MGCYLDCYFDNWVFFFKYVNLLFFTTTVAKGDEEAIVSSEELDYSSCTLPSQKGAKVNVTEIHYLILVCVSMWLY